MRYEHLKGVKNLSQQLLLFVALWVLALNIFANTQVESMRLATNAQGARLSLDLSHSTVHNVFTLDNPARLVVDLQKTRINPKIQLKSCMHGPVTNIRYATNEKGTLRIVFDLKSQLFPSSFNLTAKQKNMHTLVIDLGAEQIATTKRTTTVAEAKTPRTPKTPKAPKNKTRQFIVAIDPGHGGEDTGAIGHTHHLREKDVVLAVSKQLNVLINAQPGMKSFLVRNGDYYIGLRKRMTIAREQGADLFISVHADAFNDTRAKGASVFVLSEKGASNEAARWLAERENRSDLIGGVSLEDKGNILASVLLDLSQTASQSASNELASNIMGQLGKITDLHHKTVQSAGFAVLKSPDIPSVLVELGFISNQQGEEQLVNPRHQRALANAILAGVKSYAKKRPLQPQENWDVASKSQSAVIASAE